MRRRRARPASLRRRVVAACVEGCPGGALALVARRLDRSRSDLIAGTQIVEAR